MKEPVRIFSDLHLGSRVSRIRNVSALRPLLEDAGTVVFNGDTWQELAPELLERSREMLDQLRTLAAEAGCEVVFLPGNHDPGWPGNGWIELADGRIVVTHGDTLLPDGAPWKREILTNPEQVREIWEAHPAAETDPLERHQVAREISMAFPTLHHPHGRHLFQRAWDAAIPPQRALHMLAAWWTQADDGAALCERFFPKAELLVIGHFHRHGSWLRRGRRIVNTGSFVPPGRAMWVEWRDGLLSRGFIEESPDTCLLGPAEETWRFDPPQPGSLAASF